MKFLFIAAAFAAGLSSAHTAEGADKKLNDDYKKLQTQLADDADTKKLLTEAQRRWIAYRDAECTFQASGVSGGSAYGMVFAACVEKLTNARLQDFSYYLSCKEGDMTCPVPAP